ncbi:nuclear transport factor 2 family protein [Paenarthrobacter nicotinovorans]|uniref:nuclear transport factor 2 family protein n=1 Tax=Paenarthrobacter nicotinovorans TaxID=29320 RepID=UPI003809302B
MTLTPPRATWIVDRPDATQSINYGGLVALAERYFAAVDDNDLDTIVDSFAPDATFTIQSAHSSHQGHDAIRKMFEEYFADYSHIRHIHFRHIVDVETQSIASQFRSEQYGPDGKEMFMTSSNFFYVENGRFTRVFVYMSDGNNVLG